MCGFCQFGDFQLCKCCHVTPHGQPNNKKSLNKTGNTFCCELLNRTGLGQCVMQASTKLCLAFFEFFTVLENKRFFQLDPVPQGIFIRS